MKIKDLKEYELNNKKNILDKKKSIEGVYIILLEAISTRDKVLYQQIENNLIIF